MLTARNKERAKSRRISPLNVLLSERDEATALACRECHMTYMKHDGDLYTKELPTQLSRTPSLTGPGVFGLGTRHSQKRADGRPLV